MLKSERLTFFIETAQPEKILNKLKEYNIAGTDIKFSKYILYGTTSIANRKYIAEICKEENVPVKFKEPVGAHYIIMRYKKRYGIFAGILLCLALCFIMSNFVFYIEITGNNEISQDKILYSLKENGICAGKFIPSLDFLSAERMIAQQYDKIAWISIRSSGGRIVADIDETEPPPDILPENIPCNIVASRDAQITGVRVLNGLLIPLVGDAVRKGDMLVSGTMENLHGETRVVRALGSVKGIYQEKQVFSQPLHTIENVPTGEIIVKRRFNLLSFSMPIDFKSKPEVNFDFSSAFQPVSFFSLKLPFGVTTEKYYPYDSKEVFYTEDEGIKILDEKMNEFEKTFYSDKSVKSREIQKNICGEMISYSVLYTLEGEIGKNEAIILKN